MISKTFYLFIWPSRQNNHVNPQAPLTCYWPLHTQSVGSCPDFLRILSLIAFWIEWSRSRGGDRLFYKESLRTWSEELHQNSGEHSCDYREKEQRTKLFHQLAQRAGVEEKTKHSVTTVLISWAPLQSFADRTNWSWWVQQHTEKYELPAPSATRELRCWERVLTSCGL